MRSNGHSRQYLSLAILSEDSGISHLSGFFYTLLEKEAPMADAKFDALKLKYQSALNFMQSQNVQLQNINMEGDKLFIRATAPSTDIKNKVWDQIKLVDPSFSDLTAEIDGPAAQAAAAASGTSSSARTYHVQPGDNLSKISKQFYGDANKYLKIYEANKDKMSDPDHVRAGTDLVIPQ
jgi:nucleoid-associated protein YgaU